MVQGVSSQSQSIPRETPKKIETDTNIYGKYNGKSLDAILATQKAKQAQDRSKLETVVDVQNKKLESLNDIKELTLNLSNAVHALRKTNPFAQEQGVFNKLIAESVEGSRSAVTLTLTSNLVERQVIPMDVKRLASNDLVKGQVGVPANPDEWGVSKTDPLTIEGPLIIQGKEITITTDMNLFHVMNAINDASKETHVTASITTVNNEYYLSYSCTKTGLPISVDTTGLTHTTDQDDTWKGIFPPSSTKTKSDLSCQVTLRGFDVEYPSNIITDQGEGLNFIIHEVGSTVLQVNHDYEAMNEALRTFVDSFNELYTYIARPDTEADCQKNKDILNDNNIRNISKEFPLLYNDLSTILNLFGGSFRHRNDIHAQNTLTELKNTGLTFNPLKGLEFAGDTWVSNLVESFDLVVKTFTFSATSSDRNMTLLNQPDSMPDASLNKNYHVIKRNVSDSQEVTQELVMTYNSSEDSEQYIFTQDSKDSNIFKGPPNTPMENIVLYHRLASDIDTTISFSQGFASKLRQDLKTVIDPSHPTKNTSFKRQEDIIHQAKKIQNRRIENFDKRAESENEKNIKYMNKLKESIERGRQLEDMFGKPQ